MVWKWGTSKEERDDRKSKAAVRREQEMEEKWQTFMWNKGWWQPCIMRSTFISKAIKNIWKQVSHSTSYRKTKQDWIWLKIKEKEKAVEKHAAIASLVYVLQVGEKTKKTTIHTCGSCATANWRLKLSTYLTCCNRIKSVQKPHSQQKANLNILRAKGSEQWKVESEWGREDEKICKEIRDGPVSSEALVWFEVRENKHRNVGTHHHHLHLHLLSTDDHLRSVQ